LTELIVTLVQFPPFLRKCQRQFGRSQCCRAVVGAVDAFAEDDIQVDIAGGQRAAADGWRSCVLTRDRDASGDSGKPVADTT